jgi:hypothetical protein
VVTHFVTVRQRLLKVEGVADVTAPGVHISDDAMSRISNAFAVPPSGGIRDAATAKAD